MYEKIVHLEISGNITYMLYSEAMERRHGYSFSLEAKKLVHAKAGNKCLYEDIYGKQECPNPNTGRVNHITGAFEGWLKGADKRDISNPDMNATMECVEHERIHDATERLEVQRLKGERIIYERKIGEHNRRNQPFNQRRFNGKRR